MSLTTDNISKLYNLDTFFPKDKYTKDNKKLALHYLIVYRNLSGAAKWLKDHPEYAAIKEPKSLLTPLHLCAITGSVALTKLLLDNSNVSIAEQDVRKWTPLHHAALLEDQEILEILLVADKTKNLATAIKNENNGTYENLRKMAFPELSLANIDPQIFYRSTSTGEIIKGTVNDFLEMTGAKFTNQMYASPSFFIEEWGNPTEISGADRTIVKLTEADYEGYLQKPPALYLDKVENEYGVFSLEDIPEGSILVDYLGEATHLEEKSSYAMRLSNGTKVRNFGPMINDGFPNCVDMSLNNIKGFPMINVLFATSKIKKGEQLLWNYGALHPVKDEKYVNFAGKYAEQWFRENPLIAQFKKLQTISQSPINLVNFRSCLTPIHYLLATTSFQIILMLKRIVTIDDVYTITQQTYFKKREGSFFVQKKIEASFRIVDCFFNLCKNLEKPEEGESEIIALVENLFSKFRTSTVFKLLQTMASDDPEISDFVSKLIKGDSGLRAKLWLGGKQIEEMEELYNCFCQKINAEQEGKQLASALMKLDGPLASNITTHHIIWPLKAAFPTKYKMFLDFEGVRKHLDSLNIFY